jgi:hypothetical protein
MQCRRWYLVPIAIFPSLVAFGLHAEPPMTVDDAGTLPKGGAKLEFGWTKDGGAKGWEAAAGYAPVDTVELEINGGRVRDSSLDPRETTKGVGAAIKWVPVQSDGPLAVGLKYAFLREKVDGGSPADVNALIALVSWTFEAGPTAHFNAGGEWRDEEGARNPVATWGVGVDWPLTDRLDLTLEMFGARHARPDRAIGLRYELIEGVKLSGAVGRGSDRTIANLGVAWEF